VPDGRRRRRCVRARAYQPVPRVYLGRAALQNHLSFEPQDAVVDVEGVRHDDGVRDALPVVLSERASAAVVGDLLVPQLRTRCERHILFLSFSRYDGSHTY
jgi:hypothetical protein